jgi:hypothetical protein
MTDYSKCSVQDLQDEVRLAEARIRREQRYISELKEIISVRVMTSVREAGGMVHSGCIADS